VSVSRHVAFCRDLVLALWHGAREAYYALALKTIGHSHPDSWIVTRRMLLSRSKVNDFLNRYTN
jgi:hypothetical protein